MKMSVAFLDTRYDAGFLVATARFLPERYGIAIPTR